MKAFRRSRETSAGLLAIALAASACVTPPRPTAAAVRRSANSPAVVEGRVSDGAGRPVSGVSVWGLPRDKDLGWSSPAVTDAAGRFRLSLFAPGDYGFLLGWRGISVVTASPDDPSRVPLTVRPGERKSGVALLFRREAWDRAIVAPR